MATLRARTASLAGLNYVRNGWHAETSRILDTLVGDSRFNHVVVHDATELPAPSDGEHLLAENTLYEFNGTVSSPAGLRFQAGSMIRGKNFSGQDNFLYTGSGAALRATAAPYFAAEMGVIAPAGSAMDVSANATTEMFLTLVNFFGCASLGTISGYRVPTIVKCNFENFTTGLTFTGTSDKIFLDSCPFRGAAANAKGITFDADFQTDIIDITGSYFKAFGTSAVGISFNGSATLSSFGLVRGTAFTIATPLEGFGPESVAWDFTGNSGVRNSRVLGEIRMDANATATTLTQNTWTKIAGTTASGLLERFTMPQTNRLTYTGRREAEVAFTAALSVSGSASSQAVEFALYKNGEIESPALTTVLTGPAGARADSVTLSDMIRMTATDYIEVWMRCTSGSDNATVTSLQLTAQG
jgi:hypothetical protein